MKKLLLYQVMCLHCEFWLTTVCVVTCNMFEPQEVGVGMSLLMLGL